MARRSGFLHTLAQLERESKRAEAAQVRSQSAAVREAERAQRAYERARAADEKEARRLHVEAQMAEVAALNQQLDDEVAELSSLLARTLSVDDYFDLETLKNRAAFRDFDPGELGVLTPPTPDLDSMMPKILNWMSKRMPGAQSRWETAAAGAREAHQRMAAEREQAESDRMAALSDQRSRYEAERATYNLEMAAQHGEVDELISALAAGDPEAVRTYVSLVLERSTYPDGFPREFRLAYVAESQQLVIELQLPDFNIVPSVRLYRYVKTSDTIGETARPERERRAIYESLVGQCALRTIHEVFEADRDGRVETVVFNGHVSTIDRSTGRIVILV
jgi:restriction system protein